MPTNILPIASEDAYVDRWLGDGLVVALKADGEIPRRATVEVLIVDDHGGATLVETLTRSNPMYVCKGTATYRFKRTIGTVGVFAS